MKPMTGIYLVTNKVNGHQYVGQSVDIKRRWIEHTCPSSISNNRTINKAYRKYGKENFVYEVLEECAESELDEREIYWIEKLRPVYNMTKGGVGVTGHHHTEEVKRILAIKAKKQWDSLSDKEKNERLTNNLKGPQKGHQVSKETKEILRKKQLGKKLSEETKRKISESNKGKNDNKSHLKTLIALNDEGVITGVFFGVRFAGEFFGIDPSCITGVLKGRRKHAAHRHWEYWSVETIGDECNQVGGSLSPVEVRDTRKGEEIVRTTEMVNSWVFDKGLIELAERSGQFKNIIDEVVYEGQLVKKNKFTGEYVFDEDAKTSDTVIGYMARLDLINGFSKTIFWTKEEVEAHAKKFSQAFRSGYTSPWKTDFDAMARKTVLKALFSKYAPKSIAIQQAIKFDQAVVRADTGIDGDDINIDAFEADYVDNEPGIQEATAEEVNPCDDLFGNQVTAQPQPTEKKG